jgi:4-hydroxy 2-oxovalerate aldolase
MFDHFDPPPPQPRILLAKLVDVTLRDGGFEVDFHWPRSAFAQVATSVGALGVDIVELGYIGGVPLEHSVATPGRGAFLTEDLVASASGADATLAGMIHPTALGSPIELGQYADAGLGMVRLVYHPNWFPQIASLAAQAKRNDLRVTVNIAMASRYGKNSLLEHAERICTAAPIDVLYVADTCGALEPGPVGDLIASLRAVTGTDIGFHAHDFLTFAYANCLAAAAAGASYLDCSVLGLGRGAGNWQTELALICHRMLGSQTTGAVRNLLDCRRELGRMTNRQNRPLLSMICGALNLTPVEESALLTMAEQARMDPDEAALRLLISGQSASTLRPGAQEAGWLVTTGGR